MENEDHYYAEGYGLEDDPYVMENGVLINAFNIQDIAILNRIEARLSSIAIDKILSEEPPSVFDVSYHQYLHHQIFKEVYPWAGQFRKVDIGKGDSLFLKHQEIEVRLNQLFDRLAERSFLMGVDHEEFSTELGESLVELNHIHPFREGNGRTQRLLVSKLAQHAGFQMNWQSISSEAMKRACIEGVGGNTRKMVRLILLNTQSH